MYADDTNLTFASNNIDDKNYHLNHDLANVNKWLIVNRLTLNQSKTEFMLIGSRQRIATFRSATSYPGSFHYAPRWRKDPGPGWSRVSQILGDNYWDLWGVGKANVAFVFKTIQGV